jgi:hypothetical protein
MNRKTVDLSFIAVGFNQRTSIKQLSALAKPGMQLLF